MLCVKDVLAYSADTGLLVWSNGRPAGCKRRDGYLVVRVQGVLHYAHRLAWEIIYGAKPTGLIDHINGIRSDNRIENLRDVSPTINAQNTRLMVRPGNLSGYKGVQRNHSGWQAVINDRRKRICLGTFKSPEEAHQVYLEEKRRRHEGSTI